MGAYVEQAWVVGYTTGEYSDRSESIERVFASEASARAWADERNAWLKSKGLYVDEVTASYETRQEVQKEFGRYVDYTGGEFEVQGPFEVQP